MIGQARGAGSASIGSRARRAAARLGMALCLALAMPGGARAEPDPGRTLIMPGLGDPDVLSDGSRVLLTGTLDRAGARRLKFWESRDLTQFTPAGIYDPSAVDPRHDYCRIWAPDLSLDGGRYVLAFSALRHAPGTDCPKLGGLFETAQVTTFIATSPVGEIAFGPPVPINPGTGLPRSDVTRGCPTEGCNHAIRIDADLSRATDPGWFFYTWFDRGNNVSAFRLDAPDRVRDILRPYPNYANPRRDVAYEERITEAPDHFTRNGIHYLVYSRGHVHRSYGLSYLMADSAARFEKARGAHSLSTPAFTETGPGCVGSGLGRNYRNLPLVENMGHGSVIEHRGRHYIFYHVGQWRGAGCDGYRRKVYRQALRFRDDGTIESLTDLYLVWSGAPGRSYALDVQLGDGTWIAPCVGADILGRTPSYRFTGVCPSAPAPRAVHKSEIAQVRLVQSRDGTRGDGVGERQRTVAYDGGEVLRLDPPGQVPSVAVTWTGTGRRGEAFSLDVVLKDGRVIGPCVDAGLLDGRHAHAFDGTCPAAPGAGVTPDRVAAFRVCSATGRAFKDWSRALCETRARPPGADRVHIDMGGG